MRSKISNYLKNNRLYFVTFIIGVLIVGFIYQLNNVTPLGDNSLLCVDFYHQYGPMLGELYDRLHSFSNFTYSFT
ncbi:MAG: YfhO family protein, partial [Bacilli bacterium]|nr:YfhO family protein [Bacilli bacterium]